MNNEQKLRTAVRQIIKEELGKSKPTLAESSFLTVDLWDEIGDEIDALKEKLEYLKRRATNNVWVHALGRAEVQLFELEKFLGNAGRKLGVINID